MNIVGKHVLLRAIESADLPHLNRWANDPAIQYLIGGWHFPTSMRDQEQWLALQTCSSIHQRFAIEVESLGLIGTANLVSIDWKNRTATHGTLIGDPLGRGQGFGVDSIMAVMRYAFDELGLARLDSDIIENNIPSQMAYLKKCGWSEEGRRKNWYYRQGQRWDKLLIGIEADIYRELARKTQYWTAP